MAVVPSVQGGADACSALACFADQEHLAGSLASTSYMGVQSAVERGKKVAVPFDEAGFLAQAPYALPPAHGVVKFVGQASRPKDVVELAAKLRADGYSLAVDVGAGQPELAELAALADVWCFDAGCLDDPAPIAARNKGGKALLWASRVGSLDTFEKLKAAGFADAYFLK